MYEEGEGVLRDLELCLAETCPKFFYQAAARRPADVFRSGLAIEWPTPWKEDKDLTHERDRNLTDRMREMVEPATCTDCVEGLLYVGRKGRHSQTQSRAY